MSIRLMVITAYQLMEISDRTYDETINYNIKECILYLLKLIEEALKVTNCTDFEILNIYSQIKYSYATVYYSKDSNIYEKTNQ